MSLIAKKKASIQIPLLEASTYLAVCVGVVDIGEQKNETFNNYSSKVIFIYEIPSERVDADGESKPRWLSETYTVSLNEKSNLAKMLLSWRGKAFTDAEMDGFDLTEMLGKPCQLQVLVVPKKDGSPCNRIAGVFGIPKGFPIPSPENPLLKYDIADGENDTFKQLPEWIRDRIAKSTEWQQAHNGTEKLSFDAALESAPVATVTTVNNDVKSQQKSPQLAAQTSFNMELEELTDPDALPF